MSDLRRRMAGILAPLLTASACTTTNTVVLKPLDTPFPVSLSDQYLDNDGRVVAENDYEFVDKVNFQLVAEAPRGGEATTELAVSELLSKAVNENNGEAIVNLNLQATDYDPGDTYNAFLAQFTGWTSVVTGALLLVTAGLIDNEDSFSGDDGSSTFQIAGGITLGVGALFVGLGFALNEPARWTFEGSGEVVRRVR